MLFNSYEFLFIFLPFTFFVYFYLNSRRLLDASKGFLVASSLFFYSWWNIVYLPLILSSMLFNYVLGKSLNKENKYSKKMKRQLLTFGIIGNLSLLGYFKYADFFIENSNYLFNSNLNQLELALPLAISFFTFQQIAYLVDSYREETKEYDLLNYAVFVCFFPQLIAGPIVHHKEIMPQFENMKNKVKNYRNILLGLFIFSIGLFKKVIIADTFAVWATNGFDFSEKLNFIEAWVTSISYTFQLYFDFSGYTDMAIGIALLFNIKLPINFNSPYKAQNIQDFWRRWHMTLSKFLKDYIYIPLGGNKFGNFRIYSNLMITFLLGGLWHGAGWTFVFWGFLHGIALVIHRIWQQIGFKIHPIIAWIITFNFINITWIFFRAKEWDDAIKVLKGMFCFSDLILPNALQSFLVLNNAKYDSFYKILFDIKGDIKTILFIIFSFVIVLLLKNTNSISLRYTYKQIIMYSFIFVIGVSDLFEVGEFLYFNF